jgi:hypothetical protein
MGNAPVVRLIKQISYNRIARKGTKRGSADKLAGCVSQDDVQVCIQLAKLAAEIGCLVRGNRSGNTKEYTSSL